MPTLKIANNHHHATKKELIIKAKCHFLQMARKNLNILQIHEQKIASHSNQMFPITHSLTRTKHNKVKDPTMLFSRSKLFKI